MSEDSTIQAGRRAPAPLLSNWELVCSRSLRAAVILLALLPGRPLAAQTIRGELVEETLQAPIEGAFIVLLDETEEQAAAMLTNAIGRFVLQAPAPGRYRVRAERIGYESFTSPALDLRAGETLDYRMTMPVRPIQLADISVETERQCEMRKAEGARVAALWEEARKALTTAVWTEKERNFRFTTQLWDRLLDPRNLEILEQQRETVTGLASYPFRALPAEQLAASGYVRRVEDASATEYYAPDAETLLSDVFIDDHCFRVVEGRGPTSGMVGLAFEPARPVEGKTDVSGVLWLGARNAHLRYVEYRYENLPAGVRESEKLGGRLEFRMLPGGAWVVDDWYIRMPVTDVALEGDSERSAGTLRDLREKRKLVAIKEEGGAVIRISDPEGRDVGLGGRGSLAGLAFDSTRNEPLAFATVSLLGTNHRARTNEEGLYSMPLLPPGNFFVTISHPRVGMLRLGSALRPVQIRAGEQVTVDLAIPPARLLAATLCPGQDGGIVVGLVVDERTGEPLENASVRLFSPLRNVPGAGTEASGVQTDMSGKEISETRSDSGGGFLLCGVPTDEILYLGARLVTAEGHKDSGAVPLTLESSEIHEALLEVALPAGGPSGS